ncbi:MAG: helix-turn-helix domain-containing protein [Pseudonocardia sp.]
MTTEDVDIEAERARVNALRRELGDRLGKYRQAAGVTQRILGETLGRTRTMMSRIESGARGMTAEQWAVADEVCGAQGALITAHRALAAAELEYGTHALVGRRAAQRAAAQVEVDALKATPLSHAAGLAGVRNELAEELMQVITKLVRRMGRRDAMRVAGLTFATVGLSGLDGDECVRVAQALDSPHRVDAQVIRNLAVTLAHCKRQEDALGPAEVLPTVVAQHGVVQRLRAGGCPEGGLSRSLLALESDMASAIGGYLLDQGDPDGAARYFRLARKAGHDARSPGCAAYAAANMSQVARLSGEAHTAMDTAAAARSLAARTDDPRLKALAEQRAADAYALDGDHGLCLAAHMRAKELVAGDSGSAPASPAYWVHEGWLDSRLSVDLTTLNRPKGAVESASNALAHNDRSHWGIYAFALVYLGAALVADREIGEAARVLGDAAGLADTSPRLTAELRAARAGMAPWQGTPAVRTLDEQLAACGIVLG